MPHHRLAEPQAAASAQSEAQAARQRRCSESRDAAHAAAMQRMRAELASLDELEAATYSVRQGEVGQSSAGVSVVLASLLEVGQRRAVESGRGTL